MTRAAGELLRPYWCGECGNDWPDCDCHVSPEGVLNPGAERAWRVGCDTCGWVTVGRASLADFTRLGRAWCPACGKGETLFARALESR